MGKIIGIDLGTTNCCAAVLQGGTPQVLPTRQGQRTMPSFVAFTDGTSEVVGATALRQAVTNPHRTISGVKRLIGRKAEDPGVVAWKRLVPYDIVAADNGDARVRTRDREYSPEEVSAALLSEVKRAAEEYLGEPVTEAVVTVPAYFDDGQRQATKNAGTIAGLEVRHILTEPTAAALGYGIERNHERALAVFDLGGGTFDVTIMRIADGVFEVLATHGDTLLGGNDFDQRLIDYLAEAFRDKHGVDLREDAVALQRLQEAAETAKCELSTAPTTNVNLPFIHQGPSGPVHLQHELLPREKLEELTEPLLTRLREPCERAMKDAGLSNGDIDQVLLVGGMTRMPAVRREVKAIFGQVSSHDVNPDEIVAVGAATQSAILTGELDDVALLDVTPHSLGIRIRGDRMSRLVERNTTIPTSARKLFTTTQDGQQYVEILVYQGEADQPDANTFLGRVTLTELPDKPAGKVNVMVDFTLDADGVLEVSAKDVESGKQTSVRLTPAGGLSKGRLEALASERQGTVGVGQAC